MFNTTKAVLAAVLVFGAASAVLANDFDTGVRASQAERDWRESQGLRSQSRIGNGRGGNTAYAYVRSHRYDVYDQVAPNGAVQTGPWSQPSRMIGHPLRQVLPFTWEEKRAFDYQDRPE